MIPEKLKSRKLALALVGCVLPIITAYLMDDVEMAEALKLAIASVCTYLVAQGIVDAKTMEGWVPPMIHGGAVGPTSELEEGDDD
jgi:uncharacterized membrane protein